MNSYIKNLPTPIAIIGLGKSGEAALHLLLEAGIERTQIFTFDEKKGSADLNSSQSLLDLHPQTLVVSPGVPLRSPYIEKLIDEGAQLSSEIDLATSFISTEKVIGITGSIGKSTTTAALGHALSAWDPHVFVGGNLGTPLAEYVLELLQKKRERASWLVLELSSYQLENSKNLKIDYGIITYLSANHLERYDSLEHYYKTKSVLFPMTKKLVFCNSLGGDLQSWLKKFPKKNACFVDPKEIERSFDFSQSRLIGAHNKQNLALSYKVLEAISAPIACYEKLLDFSGLSHRMENLGTLKGVRFVNDSKATAMDSVLTAVASCDEDTAGTLWVLLGGKDKNLPWQELKRINSRKACFVFFGECREKAQGLSTLSGKSFSNLSTALDYVLTNCQSGDTVLLSPGGTSLDEFKGFEDRGNFFADYIRTHFI